MTDRKYRGLGYDVSNARSIKEALKLAQLDWPVHGMPINADLPGGLGKTIPASGWKAIIRPDKTTDTGFRILDVASSGYEITANADLFEVFDRIAKMGEMKLEYAGAINHGERLFAIARIAGEFHFPGVSDKSRIDHGVGTHELDDSTYLKVLMGAGHRAGIANTIDILAERQICTNGAVITQAAGRWKFVHRKKFTSADKEEIVAFVGRARALFEQYKEKAELLHSTKFEKEISQLYVVELLQKQLLADVRKAILEKHTGWTEDTLEYEKALVDTVMTQGRKVLDPGNFSLPVRTVIAKIDNQPGAEFAPDTAWNTYNAVTYYIDHLKGRTADTGLESAFYGGGAKTKFEALSLAVNYADRLA